MRNLFNDSVIKELRNRANGRPDIENFNNGQNLKEIIRKTPKNKAPGFDGFTWLTHGGSHGGLLENGEKEGGQGGKARI